MKLAKSGFTIIELLIVIVVIAILASISIVTYNGVQTRAHNTVALSELNEWRKVFELYRALEGSLPNVPNGMYCLGTGFPIGHEGIASCIDINGSTSNYASEQSSAQLMNELRKVGGLPGGPRIAVNGSVGPFAQKMDLGFALSAVIRGNDPSLCTAPSFLSWQDHQGRIFCSIMLSP